MNPWTTGAVPMWWLFGHHRSMSANVAKASAGVPSTTTDLRTGAIWMVRFISLVRFSWLHLFRERRERVIPEFVQPAAQLAEAFGIDVVHAARALGSILHEPGLLQ